MPTFYDSKGNSYDLTEQIGRGGEGTVFACPNDLKLVAKIYHEPITDEKAEKLRWMADNQNERLLKVAAWIVDTLTDAPDGKTVGFLMPNVKAKEIHELYSLKSRRVYFPDATWQFLVHTAANLARAFYNLHKSEHIMGDVNHGNCVVLADGTVKLIDCDSYSIKKDDSRYRCEVGVGTHLAPELQGKNLRDIERLEKHDNFGLAVIIFQLLFLGRHPFAGIYLGEEDKSIEDCIRELRFAFGSDAKLRQVKQPPGTLSLSQVSPRIALMLERAFITEDRPEAHEWIEVLEDLSHNLKNCALHPGHHYFQDLTACPWCGIEAQTGLMLFPFVSGNRSSDEESFNIFTVENLIQSLNIPHNLPATLPKPLALPPPTSDIKNERMIAWQRLGTCLALQFIGVLFVTFMLGNIFALFLSVVFTMLLWVYLHDSFKTLKESVEDSLEDVRRDWNNLGNDWEKSRTNENFDDNLAQIKDKIGDYQTLQQKNLQKIKLLQENSFQYHLETYLSSFKIGEATSLKIENSELSTLKNYGVRNAMNAEEKHLRAIPTINGATIVKLLEWRKNLERKFALPADKNLPVADEQRLTGEFAEKRRKLEKDIERLLIGLRSGAVTLRQKHQQLFAKSDVIVNQLVQAESNVKAIGNNIPATVGLVSVGIFSLILGSGVPSSKKPTMFNEPSDYPNYSTSRNYGSGSGIRAESNGYGTSSGIGSGSNYSGKTYSENYQVAENLTDEQIESMTDWERRSGAKTLEKEALELAYYDKSYKKAEKKLRLAVRLIEYDENLFNQLAVVLYEQKKYKESLEFLDKALNIDSGNTVTKLHIGKNYVKLGKFDEARVILTHVTDVVPSHEAYYYLGMACKGLNEDQSAISSFRKSVGYYPQDVEAHFELGSALNKIGNKEGARAEYETLLNLDQPKAENLKRIIYFGGK